MINLHKGNSLMALLFRNKRKPRLVPPPPPVPLTEPVEASNTLRGACWLESDVPVGRKGRIRDETRAWERSVRAFREHFLSSSIYALHLHNHVPLCHKIKSASTNFCCFPTIPNYYELGCCALKEKFLHLTFTLFFKERRFISSR